VTGTGASVDRPGGPGLRRLHPLTPLIKSARVLGALGALVSYQSYRNLQDIEAGWALAGYAVLGLAVIAALAFAISWVSWRYTGFRLSGDQLVIVEGVVARRSRTVPLARVQAVDVVRPVLARLLGLAEVRLEVVGGGKTEAPLAYLSVPEAQQVRGQLLAVANVVHAGPGALAGSAAASGSAAPGAAGATVQLSKASRTQAGEQLYAVPRQRLLISQALTGQVLMLPVIAVPSVVLAITTDGLTFAGLFGAASAIVGLGSQVVRRLTTEWDFRVVDGADGLRLQRGLLETRSQTVPTGRVQAVRIRRPVLWLPLGWLRVEVDVAGYGGSERAGRTSGVLLPVGTAEEVYEVLARVLPGVRVPSVLLVPAPPAAGFRAPVAARRLAAGVGAEVAVLRSGRLTEILTVVPFARIQSVRVVQGPWQRALGLATVAVDTAARRIAAVAAHRSGPDARRLAGVLAERAADAVRNDAGRGGVS
jgi:putative membrane protein